MSFRNEELYRQSQILNSWYEKATDELLEHGMRYFNVRRRQPQYFDELLNTDSSNPPYHLTEANRQFKYSKDDENWYHIDAPWTVSIPINIGDWKEHFYKELERREKYLTPKPEIKEIVEEIVQKEIKKENLFICGNCGNNCELSFLFCPFCQIKFDRCEICKFVIKPDIEIAICSNCGESFHKGHWSEVLKVNGKCPLCKKKPKDLIYDKS
jgi:hypothetical protein